MEFLTIYFISNFKILEHYSLHSILWAKTEDWGWVAGGLSRVSFANICKRETWCACQPLMMEMGGEGVTLGL